jgi:RNA polymerase sigma-70 factor (ECF subfamily)
MQPIILTLLALGLLVAGDEPKSEDAKKEAEALRGTWTFSKMERDGGDLTDQFGGVEVRFEAEKFSSPGIEATFTLDPTKTPKAIDISYKEGPAAGQTIKAIYKLEGETLTICRALSQGDERPKEFAAPAGSGRFLFQFKRNKPGSR